MRLPIGASADGKNLDPPRSRPKGVHVLGAVARDACLTAASLWGAALLRFDGHVPENFARNLIIAVPLAVALIIFTGFARGIFRSLPQYASVGEVLRIVEAVLVSTLAMTAAATVMVDGQRFLPMSVPLITGLLQILLLGGARLWSRLSGYLRSGRTNAADASRVLIVGAGDAGEMVARDMRRNPEAGYRPIAFVDDDPQKVGRRIHGIPVVATTEEIAEAASGYGADVVLVAMPSAPSRVIRRVLAEVTAAHLKIKIIPGLGELMRGEPSVADIRDVDIADLIGRDAVRIDSQGVASFLQDRCVLVTGAAGSIGSALAAQVLSFRPSTLVLLDIDETDIYALKRDLEADGIRLDSTIEMVVCDVRDRRGVDAVFQRFRPQVVFHAAAHKHVPVMEVQPDEAVLTNVSGSRNLAEAAIDAGVEKFIFVSTDKAVRPTSVMGATKRVAERLISDLGRERGTVFASVRFGNVLGSRGSVVPIFAEQIRRGGPITVTDPETTRYFMTIEEAASLIIQAGALAERGETFVLDMGEPVKILDLAERMRDLLGNGDHDRIPITFVGLRPGEKLHEELWQEDERLLASPHPRIKRAFVQADARLSQREQESLETLERLAAQHADSQRIREFLFELATSRDVPSTAKVIRLS